MRGWMTREKKTEEKIARGRREISAEQPCGVWSRKLARQHRQLYSTDTMSERHNGSHAESRPALYRAAHTGLKRALTSRSTPWKEREGMYLTQRHQKRKVEHKTVPGALPLRIFSNSMFAFIIAVGVSCLASICFVLLKGDPSIRVDVAGWEHHTLRK